MTPAAPSATYLYALVQHRGAPSVAKAPAGLPDTGRVRVIDAGGDLWLIAADAPLERYGAAPIERGLRDLDWVSERALAHERVVEHFARADTTVPMKLFTLFASDERAIGDIRRRRARLERVLGRLAGREEYGVRVRLDPRSRAGEAAPGDGTGAGTRFLRMKRAAREAERRTAERARRSAVGLYRALGREAAGSRRLPIVAAKGGTRLLLDAAFLVDRDRAAAFRRAVRAAAARAARDGCGVDVTGPWPAYNFVARA